MKVRQRTIPASSNGRTSRFGRGDRGSNPCAGAISDALSVMYTPLRADSAIVFGINDGRLKVYGEKQPDTPA